VFSKIGKRLQPECARLRAQQLPSAKSAWNYGELAVGDMAVAEDGHTPDFVIFHRGFHGLNAYSLKRMDIKNLNEAPSFITKDGSEIRELLAHRNSVIRNQSLAEARVPVGASTRNIIMSRPRRFITSRRRGTDPHCRRNARRENRRRHCHTAGCKHKLWNNSNEPLRLLCCCAPAYEHDDTVITEKI